MKKENKLQKGKPKITKEEKIKYKVKISFSTGNKLSLEDIHRKLFMCSLYKNLIK